MNRRVFCTFAILVSVLCVTVNCSACGNKSNAVAESPARTNADSFVPDQRFASIDSLADFMTEALSAKTVEEFVNRYEQQAVAIKSYGYLNHGGEDKNLLDETVCSDLSMLADSLSYGSTMDMVMCGRILCAVCHYLTAKCYCGKYSGNPLYQAEMSDWLALEDELGGLYGDLSYLTNWGGSLAHVIASSSMWSLAENRENDYSNLHRNGSFNAFALRTIASAREYLLEKLAAAKGIDGYDDMSNADDYRALRQQISERADRVPVLLDKWLASRAQLCEAEAIPDSQTANLVSFLGTEIMRIIEE